MVNQPGDQEAGLPVPPVNRSRRMGRLLWCGLCLGLLSLAFGCRTYYGQAIRGEWQILVHRQPIRKLLASPQTPAPLRAKLQLVLRLDEFAQRELSLPADGNFLSYVDVHREHLIWNVYAAPEFSLEAKTWWYPVVGRLKYRGYFAQDDACRYAAHLAKKGWDTYVGGVDAYSTLGWFREPVISTFAFYNEADLAGIIFHELAHQEVFAKGDSDFDEAFATAVEEEGVRRWFKRTNQPAALAQYEQSLQYDHAFHDLLRQAQSRLQQLYQSPPARLAARGEASPQAQMELRRQKEQLFVQLRAGYARLRDLWPEGRIHDWISNQVNNAKLASEETYYRLTPAFRRLLAENHNDLVAFYAAVRRLAKLPKAQRHGELAP